MMLCELYEQLNATDLVKLAGNAERQRIYNERNGLQYSYPAHQPHHTSLENLQASAVSGCKLCALIFSEFAKRLSESLHIFQPQLPNDVSFAMALQDLVLSGHNTKLGIRIQTSWGDHGYWSMPRNLEFDEPIMFDLLAIDFYRVRHYNGEALILEADTRSQIHVQQALLNLECSRCMYICGLRYK